MNASGSDIQQIIAKDVRVAMASAAFLLTFAGLDAFAIVVALRPLPFLCATVALAVSILAVSLIYLALGIFKYQRKRPRIVRTLMLTALACIFRAVLPSDLPAAYEPNLLEIRKFRHLIYPQVLEDKLSTTRDFWGGGYHIRRSPDGMLVIWCDGPDGDNDNAERSIGRGLFSFEKASFVGWYPLPWRSLLRKAAYWEVMDVWGCFDGDIVWQSPGDSSVYLRPDS